MAWNTINYTCGHTEQIQLYGKNSEREKTIRRMEREACPACRRAAADRADIEAGRPALKGSDKQVAWASEIRAQMLATVPQAEKMIRDSLALAADDADRARREDLAAKFRAKLEEVRAERSAAWWIDNRGSGQMAMANLLAQLVRNDERRG